MQTSKCLVGPSNCGQCQLYGYIGYGNCPFSARVAGVGFSAEAWETNYACPLSTTKVTRLTYLTCLTKMTKLQMNTIKQTILKIIKITKHMEEGLTETHPRKHAAVNLLLPQCYWWYCLGHAGMEARCHQHNQHTPCNIYNCWYCCGSRSWSFWLASFAPALLPAATSWYLSETAGWKALVWKHWKKESPFDICNICNYVYYVIYCNCCESRSRLIRLSAFLFDVFGTCTPPSTSWASQRLLSASSARPM